VSNILFTAIFAAMGCFMASRAYLLLVKGELNVKGAMCSREGTPIAFTVMTTCAILGTAIGLIMTATGIVAIIEGWQVGPLT
jgi:hypothetical protein